MFSSFSVFWVFSDFSQNSQFPQESIKSRNSQLFSGTNVLLLFSVCDFLKNSQCSHLRAQLDIEKKQGQPLTASQVTSNNMQRLQNLICQDQAYLFLRQIPETPR